MDYTSIIPMLSRVLMGVFLGNLLYSLWAARLRSPGAAVRARPVWPGTRR